MLAMPLWITCLASVVFATHVPSRYLPALRLAYHASAAKAVMVAVLHWTRFAWQGQKKRGRMAPFPCNTCFSGFGSLVRLTAFALVILDRGLDCIFGKH
jgi:hypothetical protein